MDDGNKVSDKFFLRAEFKLVENHDSCVVFDCKVFDEFKSEPAESVSVSDNNFFDKTTTEFVQYSSQSFAFEIEPGANILNKFAVWISLSEIFGLIGQFCFL